MHASLSVKLNLKLTLNQKLYQSFILINRFFGGWEREDITYLKNLTA